jgi:hypothetical protein
MEQMMMAGRLSRRCVVVVVDQNLEVSAVT